ncbi:transposase [Desulfonema ishimotonii]|uniref:transposase n=1 Tax=Desulfonema ishimotonii TaxID=45657 RepID=UPI00140C4432|nr:transposase [Desulfonema ishimotonii]
MKHPEQLSLFGWEKVPHRTTLSRRYKALCRILCEFIRFLGIWAEDLCEVFRGKELFEDKSLFKARGPVWHRKNQKKGEIPKKLRNPDTDGTWSKSEHHGWVYGYGVHLTATESGFPADAVVETASVSESAIIDRKAGFIKERNPVSVTTDNSYCKLSRIRSWAEAGIALITPAKKLKEKKSEPAAYKNFRLFGNSRGSKTDVFR